MTRRWLVTVTVAVDCLDAQKAEESVLNSLHYGSDVMDATVLLVKAAPEASA